MLHIEIGQVGHLLFGRETRLRLAIWVLSLDQARFYQSEPPRSCGAATAIRQELSRLVDLGMLIEERSDKGGRIYYHRSDSPLWKIIDTVRRVVEDDAHPTHDPAHTVPAHTSGTTFATPAGDLSGPQLGLEPDRDATDRPQTMPGSQLGGRRTSR